MLKLSTIALAADEATSIGEVAGLMWDNLFSVLLTTIVLAIVAFIIAKLVISGMAKGSSLGSKKSEKEREEEQKTFAKIWFAMEKAGELEAFEKAEDYSKRVEIFEKYYTFSSDTSEVDRRAKLSEIYLYFLNNYIGFAVEPNESIKDEKVKQATAEEQKEKAANFWGNLSDDEKSRFKTLINESSRIQWLKNKGGYDSWLYTALLDSIPELGFQWQSEMQTLESEARNIEIEAAKKAKS